MMENYYLEYDSLDVKANPIKYELGPGLKIISMAAGGKIKVLGISDREVRLSDGPHMKSRMIFSSTD